MKYIDDDMDELFNKAGRQYPLKTEPKNWDAVSGALHPEQAVASATQKRNGFRRYLPLLLLLLIPAVYFVIEREGEVTMSSTAETNKINKTTSSQPSTAGIVKKRSDREVQQLSYAPPAEQSLSVSKEVTKKPGYVKGGLSGPPQASIEQNESLPLTDMHTLTPGRNATGTIGTTRTIGTNGIVRADGIAGWSKFPHLWAGTVTPGQPSEEIVIDQPLRQLGGENASTSVPSIDKKKPSGKIGFYYGISAAPDVSTIKGQNIKGTGYSAGIVAGYQLNLRWSVEAGVLWSRKKYFTDGKYFSKEGARIPPNINVYWLDGGCNMLEFPVLVRYDFSPKKNTFFGTMGLTSYLMKKEDYTYGADAGVGGYYEGHRKYDRSGDHLFSNLQLSAGYKFSLSPKMNMRIEPYLKTPLKKIGVGKMPITSAGLTLSLMRDFR